MAATSRRDRKTPAGDVRDLDTDERPGLTSDSDVADPLDPPSASLAGVEEVCGALESARRVYLYSGDADLAPRRIRREEALRILRAPQAASDEVVLVTARFEGQDLVIRTLEYIGVVRRGESSAKARPRSSSARRGGARTRKLRS